MRAVIVIFVPALLGTVGFLALLASRDGSSGRETPGIYLAAMCGVAGVVATASSLLFLGSGRRSLRYGVAAAALMYPLYWVYFALWIMACGVGIHDCDSN